MIFVRHNQIIDSKYLPAYNELLGIRGFYVSNERTIQSYINCQSCQLTMLQLIDKSALWSSNKRTTSIWPLPIAWYNGVHPVYGKQNCWINQTDRDLNLLLPCPYHQHYWYGPITISWFLNYRIVIHSQHVKHWRGSSGIKIKVIENENNNSTKPNYRIIYSCTML